MFKRGQFGLGPRAKQRRVLNHKTTAYDDAVANLKTTSVEQKHARFLFEFSFRTDHRGSCNARYNAHVIERTNFKYPSGDLVSIILLLLAESMVISCARSSEFIITKNVY